MELKGAHVCDAPRTAPAHGADNGARLADFFVQQWSGFAASYLALEAGFHAAEALAAWAPAARCARGVGAAVRSPRAELAAAVAILVLAAACTAAMAAAPIAAGWSVLTWAVLLGAAGAYARFQLSVLLNARFKTFPLGTFVANVVGTWVYSGVGAAGRFGVHYDNQ